ncbi:MAG: ribosomal subunit interface protein [Nitrospirae bacterium GWC2_46_6]|nr:MAG: ribosomal subunit interface protein [Nitrospirae bacterium GWA2_46_11]OGW21468.1 MAG: ribosomal subunit interface protein [Nitrospirae bacterium GWC2_46_6]OGW23953.1 MAG: ribosomal subunit interface protein [Nitrospirae bacterium GWB2_47_37]HAK89325.1 ribosome-associated translation inhibitor RaiA [Nitrospiraceae bacterium]HCZ12138.1 ribosome-associated translation inhibitor RaiA [Nitrospiraceae bacterium]
MNIIVNGRHLEITPALKSYSEEKIGRFSKYVSNITEAVVTLSVEKYRHKAEVLLKVNGVMIQAESVTGEVYSSIDEVVEKLEKQIVKYKERSHDYRKGEKKTSEVSLKAQAETGRIIKNKRFDMKPMAADEAVDQMELLDKDFFVFANQASGDVNVVYRRKDGNYGLIEPVR